MAEFIRDNFVVLAILLFSLSPLYIVGTYISTHSNNGEDEE